MNIATAGMHLTSQINVQFLLAFKKPVSTVCLFMVTHLISLAKKTNSIFTILTMYHYTLHIERLKTLFTAAIQIYCDAITEQTQPTHTMHSSDKESSSTRDFRFIDQIR